MTGPAPTALFRTYCLLANAISPVVQRRLAAKLSAQGVPAERCGERRGRASAERPAGHLLWVHAASVGESVSALALIERLLALSSELSVLVTSGTATSARVLQNRLPDRCLHQFAPLDTARPLRRFLDHWDPDAGLFVESEVWPQMLTASARRGLPLALVNARMSRSTLRTWRRFDDTFRFLMAHFSLIRTQDRATLIGLQKLGIDPATLFEGPNLKSMVQRPPVDNAELERLRAEYTGPLWAAVSTHEGEEEEVIAAHLEARETLPDLRLILVPRHPDRADAIADLMTRQGLGFRRRSRGEAPGGAEVYLADTMGETGLWYALAPLVFLGGSFGPAGGHTPWEPALFGTPVLHGPKVANFEESYARFDQAGAARLAANAAELTRAVVSLLQDAPSRHSMGQAAQALSQEGRDRLDDLARELLMLFRLPLSNSGQPV